MVDSIGSPYLIHPKTGGSEPIPTNYSKLVVGREAGLGGFTIEATISGISRKHAEFYFLNDMETVVIKDIGNISNGGTFLNNKKIERDTEYVVRDKDIIRIGPLGGEEFTFYSGQPLKTSEVKLDGGVVYVRGTRLSSLPHVQYNILKLLIDKNPFEVRFSEIKDAWRDFDSFKDEPPWDMGTVQKTVQRLRKYLDEQLDVEESIKSVRRIGYRLNIFP